MKMNIMLMVVLFFVLGLLVTPDGFAAIYKYIDKDGLINFADDLQSIPAPYRATATIVSGEAKEGEGKRPASQALPKSQMETQTGETASVLTQPQPSSETGEKASFGSRALLSAIILISALFAFLILRIIDADHKKIIAIVRVVIVWGVSVYLLYNHAGDVVRVFSSIGNKIESARHQSEEKGKKAAKAVKALNALTEQAEKTNHPDPGESEPEKKD